jgi:TrmH family RNA methyltransferase
MITSPDNPRVKQARALLDRRAREEQGRCLVEGVRLVEEAMRAGITPALVFFSPQARETPRAAELLAAAEGAGAPLWELGPAVFGTLSDTVTSQGVIAVISIPHRVLTTDPGLILVLDQVRDPGNLGTILRSAAAAGTNLVLLAPGCVDPWNPKVLRSGMGAHFRLPVVAAPGWIAIGEQLADRAVWLADAHGTMAYDQVDWTIPSVLVVGGETTGLSHEAAGLGPGRATIPMAGGIESLNAAMAATVLLFEAARQRRTQHQVGMPAARPGSDCN